MVLVVGNGQSELLDLPPQGLVEMKITTSNRGLRELRFQCCLQGIFKVVDDKLRAPIVVGYSSDGHFDSLKYLPVVSNGSLLHKLMNKRQYKAMMVSQYGKTLSVWSRATPKGGIHVSCSALLQQGQILICCKHSMLQSLSACSKKRSLAHVWAHEPVTSTSSTVAGISGIATGID